MTTAYSRYVYYRLRGLKERELAAVGQSKMSDCVLKLQRGKRRD